MPIPKPHRGVRYLGVATARDKVVQTSVKIVESQFSFYSFGFGPNKRCHDAL